MSKNVFRGKVLSKHSSFEALSQFAIEKYYLIPYPNHPDKRPNGINRLFHGGTHVASVVNNFEICFGLYEKYAPDLLQKDGKPLSDIEIKLLKLAAIYHDVANTDEYHGKPEEHAHIFKQDMIELGFDETMVNEIAEAMALKDGPETKQKKILSLAEKTEQLKHKNIYHKLLQTADCLDVIRVVRGLFDDTQLDMYHDLKDQPGFLQDLNTLKKKHALFLDQFNTTKSPTSPIHALCEFSPNCYTTIKNFYHDFDSTKDPEVLVNKIILDQENKETLEAYQDGIFVRMVDDINTDLEISRENTKILASCKLDHETIKDYLSEQEENYQQVYTPGEFKWRPATLIKKNCPIPLYGQKSENQRAFVIILPHHSETHATFFYKTNILSNSAKTGYFTYNRTIYNKAKDKKNVAALSSKLDEMNARRQGLLPDPGLHYYGKSEIEMGEILLAGYQHVGGIGVLGFNQSSAQNALKIASGIHPKIVNFYRYIPQQGLLAISMAELALQAKGKLLNQDIDFPKNLVEIEQIVAQQKESIKNIQKISNDNEPLKFKFEVHGQLLSIYMDKGRAMLVVQVDGKQEIVPTQLMPYIAQQYYREQCDKLKPATYLHVKANFEITAKTKTLFTISIESDLPLLGYDHKKLLTLLKGFGKFTIASNSTTNQLLLHCVNLDFITRLQNQSEMDSFLELINTYIILQNFDKLTPPKTKLYGSKYPKPKNDEKAKSTTSISVIKETKQETPIIKRVTNQARRDFELNKYRMMEQDDVQKTMERDMAAANCFTEITTFYETSISNFSMFQNQTQQDGTSMDVSDTKTENVTPSITETDISIKTQLEQSEVVESLRNAYREVPANYYTVHQVNNDSFCISFIANKSLTRKNPSILSTHFSNISIPMALERIQSKYKSVTFIPYFQKQTETSPNPGPLKKKPSTS